MKRLLFITDVMSNGGVEKVITNTLKGIDKSKYKITLYVMYKTKAQNIKSIPDHVEIKYLFKKSVRGSYQRIWFYLLMFAPPTLMRKFIIGNEKYDIVVTTKEIFSHPIRNYKSKKILWFHGGFDHLKKEKKTIINNIKHWYKYNTFKRFDNILLLTKNSKRLFCQHYNLKEKCNVLYNPINDREIINLSNEKVHDYNFSSNVTIICSSRLSKEKGLERLLSCCNSLLKEGYKFKLVLLGDGSEKKKLKTIILNSPLLLKNVSMLGYKENPYKYIRNSNIYVSPSHSEGFSLSIAEAIILGVPVISTNCNGPAEILDNGTYGLLVDNSDIGIYKGLKEVLSKPRLLEELKRKSIDRKKFFSFYENIKKFEDIINS
ncbi:glycosyltransferase involved in cell wall biosynthesis [Bacillus tianshenii]|uniref:Glycosyltransferase involved in cell wall biosynthesis n=1 Tax=Sutcliffiella tianshenii TaxID=1463404 RepID=A0ABS2NV12_9BACI|nr:glycosyltransferase [Bacillus tianshenii]MBM7618268.1 glycosyltransferase involved in cell wall biosynthesis [Bacillus tianshenii]